MSERIFTDIFAIFMMSLFFSAVAQARTTCEQAHITYLNMIDEAGIANGRCWGSCTQSNEQARRKCRDDCDFRYRLNVDAWRLWLLIRCPEGLPPSEDTRSPGAAGAAAAAASQQAGNPSDPTDPYRNPSTSTRQRTQDTNVCDPVSQPPPHWRERDGHCLKSCGASGGTRSSNNMCRYLDMDDVGKTWDVEYCCRERGSGSGQSSRGACDPIAQPSPDWQVKDGQCLQRCGAIGGTHSFSNSCIIHGMEEVGPAWDVPFCCRERSTTSGTPPTTDTSIPAPDYKKYCDDPTQKDHFKVVNGKCLPSCGAAYMLARNAFPGSKHHAKENACPTYDTGASIFRAIGPTWDVKYCCLEVPTGTGDISRTRTRAQN